MRTPFSPRLLIPLVASVCFLVLPSTVPAAEKAGQTTTKPGDTPKLSSKELAAARAKVSKLISGAVAALSKEYETHIKTPETPLRDKSNYFTENPVPEITPEAIIDALGRNYGNGPSESCYIKWQLLSGVPPKVDGDMARSLAQLYLNASDPLPHPSLTAMEKASLDSKLLRLTEDDQSHVEDAWGKVIAQWNEANAPILNYASALVERLPEGPDVVYLSLDRAVGHMAPYGVACDAFLNNTIAIARNWAVSAEPQQLRNMADQFDKLAARLTDTFPPKIYTTVAWDDKSKRLTWKAEQAHFINKDQVAEFRKFLIAQANQPDGGIKMKSDK